MKNTQFTTRLIKIGLPKELSYNKPISPECGILPKGKNENCIFMEENNYQLKIELDRIQPKIWRRILLSENTTLYELHHIIQISFGWLNCHLYLFLQNKLRWGNKSLWDDESSFQLNSDKRIRLKDVFHNTAQILQYEYDMGDSWLHNIKVEKVIEKDKLTKIPLCLDGERNCPPEDCGGVPGYHNLIETMNRPRSREYRELLEWLGHKYDPELIDIEKINKTLKSLKKYIKEYEE